MRTLRAQSVRAAYTATKAVSPRAVPHRRQPAHPGMPRFDKKVRYRYEDRRSSHPALSCPPPSPHFRHGKGLTPYTHRKQKRENSSAHFIREALSFRFYPVSVAVTLTEEKQKNGRYQGGHKLSHHDGKPDAVKPQPKRQKKHRRRHGRPGGCRIFWNGRTRCRRK